jgi:hypothetical protein
MSAPVSIEENAEYGAVVTKLAEDLGCFAFNGEDVVWHYTDGDGLLGILQTATIFATQVAFLNDTTETKYASELYRHQIRKLQQSKAGDAIAEPFLAQVANFIEASAVAPLHGISKFFVSSFSGEEDDLAQWARYGKKSGYAIGLIARGLWREMNSKLYRVVYDRQKQESAAKLLADSTLAFYLKGRHGDRAQADSTWAQDFFTAWDNWIYKLAPLAKDPRWKAENEYRLVHELKFDEFPQVRFKQKDGMLVRYLPLSTPCWVRRRAALLPIKKVMIGPRSEASYSEASVRLLLQQMGYADEIEISSSTLSLR